MGAEGLAARRPRQNDRLFSRNALISKTRLVGVIAALVLLIALVFFGTRSGDYVGLSPTGGFAAGGEYSSVNSSRLHSTHFGSWTGSDAHTGTLTSAPFRAGFGIDLAVTGYPSHAGEQIRIERVDGAGQMVLTFPDPHEAWLQSTVAVPLSWVGKSVRLVAVDSTKAFEGWIGVADVRRASLLDALLADVRVRLAVLTLIIPLMLFPCLRGGFWVCKRANLSPLFLFPATLVVAGIAAEAAFFAVFKNTQFGELLVLILAVAGTRATWLSLREPAAAQALRRTDAWMPFALTLGYAFFALLSVALTVPANATVFALMPLFTLPVDNALPHLLAIHVITQMPPVPFVGDWLTSDRPPLQAGFDILVFALSTWFGDGDSRYEACAVLLQASVIGMLFILCRMCGAGTRRSLGIVALAAFSGFYFLNTIYVWPKLISAAYLAIAIAIAMHPGRITTSRSIFIGVATGLALLSHTGVAFTIPALIAALFVAQRRAAWPVLGVAFAAFVVTSAPWTIYQRTVDPPGDRLLKWHIAGHIAPTAVPFGKLLIDAYTTVPASTILANKASNLGALFTNSPPRQADREFYIVRHALGALQLPFVAALLLVGRRRFCWASRFGWICAGSLAFWILAMYLPNQAVIHQGSYLTMTLMFLAGGLIATEWWPLFAVLLAAQIFDYVQVWLAPFSAAAFFTAGGIASALGCMLVVGALAMLAARSYGHGAFESGTLAAGAPQG